MSIAGLTLPENLKAMILLSSLPHSYKTVVSTIVQTTTTTNFTMEHMIALIIAESQLCHSTSHRRLWSIVLTNSHLLMKSIGLQLYNVLRIPQLHVNIVEKLTLRTAVG